MNPTETIRELRDGLRTFRETDGIDAVLRHLDTAERHFERARSEGDSDLFTDVVYRTNHVFEGLLKEAYMILSDGDPKRLSDSKITPHKIEQYLTTKRAFKPRVIDYFTIYRESWRNPSTHDYRIDFDEQEAFLAISTVTAFCFVAIGQMVQHLAASEASRLATKRPSTDRPMSAEECAFFLAEALPNLLSRKIHPELPERLSEMHVLGYISGSIHKIWPDVQFKNEPIISSDHTLSRPDLIVEDDVSKLVIEVKPVGEIYILDILTVNLAEQLHGLMRASGADAGIGVMFPSRHLGAEEIGFSVTKSDYYPEIFIIHPSN